MPSDITPNPMAELVSADEARAPSQASDSSGSSGTSSSAPAGEQSAAERLGKEPMPTDSAELHQFLKQSASIRIETPMNLHQAAAYTCLQDPQASMARKLGMLAGSVLLVMLQMRVLHAMVRGNWNNGASACSSNYDCVGHPGGGSLGPKFCFFWHYHIDGKTSQEVKDDGDWSEAAWEEFRAKGGSQGIYRTHDYEGNRNEFAHHLVRHSFSVAVCPASEQVWACWQMSEEMGDCTPCANVYIIVSDQAPDDTIVYMDGVNKPGSGPSSNDKSMRHDVGGVQWQTLDEVCSPPPWPFGLARMMCAHIVDEHRSGATIVQISAASTRRTLPAK